MGNVTVTDCGSRVPAPRGALSQNSDRRGDRTDRTEWPRAVDDALTTHPWGLSDDAYDTVEAFVGISMPAIEFVELFPDDEAIPGFEAIAGFEAVLGFEAIPDDELPASAAACPPAAKTATNAISARVALLAAEVLHDTGVLPGLAPWDRIHHPLRLQRSRFTRRRIMYFGVAKAQLLARLDVAGRS